MSDYKKQRREKNKALHGEAYYNSIGKDTTKVCCRCNRKKSILDFPKSAGEADGFDPLCKKCKASKRKKRKHKHNDEFYKNIKDDYTLNCPGCNQDLSYKTFYKDRGSHTGFHKICKECSKTERYHAAIERGWFTYYDKNKKEKQAQALVYYNNLNLEPWEILHRFARRRAEQKGIVYDLTADYIKSIWNTHCPVLGIELKRNKGRSQDDSPSIDRIVPELGYVKGNVCIISHKANRIKNNGTLNELRCLVEYLESNLSE
jgi:hypothetical protein